jgi:hypothetical protein
MQVLKCTIVSRGGKEKYSTRSEQVLVFASRTNDTTIGYLILFHLHVMFCKSQMLLPFRETFILPGTADSLESN